jgi:predicted AAA+ superfamily ATPase
MRYRSRLIEPTLKAYAGFFKVVLVTGPRQCGKSTLLRHVFPEHRRCEFDAMLDLHDARRDPELFLDNFPSPLILDEVQHVPGLLSAIKRRVDARESPGQYILTGSQNLAVLRGVAESLAGRVGILELGPMTLTEMEGQGGSGTKSMLQAWIESDGAITPPMGRAQERRDAPSVARLLWRGTMPGLLDAPDDLVPGYLDSYVSTYVERDIRSMAALRDLGDFGRFLRLAAALDAQELNFSQLGRELGVRPDTARRWLDLLAAGYQWLELPPWSGNVVKRVSGRPKGHFADTGLACRLQGIGSPETLTGNPRAGALFESFVVQQIRRLLLATGIRPDLHHYRSTGGAEVDLVIHRNGRLLPIEVKYKSRPDGTDSRGLAAFRATYPDHCAPTGIIVHAGRESYPVNAATCALSVFDV